MYPKSMVFTFYIRECDQRLKGILRLVLVTVPLCFPSFHALRAQEAPSCPISDKSLNFVNDEHTPSEKAIFTKRIQHGERQYIIQQSKDHFDENNRLYFESVHQTKLDAREESYIFAAELNGFYMSLRLGYEQTRDAEIQDIDDQIKNLKEKQKTEGETAAQSTEIYRLSLQKHEVLLQWRRNIEDLEAGHFAIGKRLQAKSTKNTSQQKKNLTQRRKIAQNLLRGRLATSKKYVDSLTYSDIVNAAKNKLQESFFSCVPDGFGNMFSDSGHPALGLFTYVSPDDSKPQDFGHETSAPPGFKNPGPMDAAVRLFKTQKQAQARLAELDTKLQASQTNLEQIADKYRQKIEEDETKGVLDYILKRIVSNLRKIATEYMEDPRLPQPDFQSMGVVSERYKSLERATKHFSGILKKLNRKRLFLDELNALIEYSSYVQKKEITEEYRREQGIYDALKIEVEQIINQTLKDIEDANQYICC